MGVRRTTVQPEGQKKTHTDRPPATAFPQAYKNRLHDLVRASHVLAVQVVVQHVLIDQVTKVETKLETEAEQKAPLGHYKGWYRGAGSTAQTTGAFGTQA